MRWGGALTHERIHLHVIRTYYNGLCVGAAHICDAAVPRSITDSFCWDLVAAPRSSNQNNYWHNVISILLSIQLESNRILLRWSPFKRSSRGRLWLMDECHQKQQHKFIREIQWGFPTQVRILPAAPCLLHANCLLVSTGTARWRDPHSRQKLLKIYVQGCSCSAERLKVNLQERNLKQS